MEEFNFYSSENDGYRGGFGDYTDPVPPMPDTPLRTGPRAPKKKRGAAKVVALLLSCALVGGSAGVGGAWLYQQLSPGPQLPPGGSVVFQVEDRPQVETDRKTHV